MGGCAGPYAGLQIGGGEFALRLSGLVRDVVFQKRTPDFHKYTYIWIQYLTTQESQTSITVVVKLICDSLGKLLLKGLLVMSVSIEIMSVWMLTDFCVQLPVAR